MNVFVIGSSSWDRLIYVDDIPRPLKEDISLWATKTFEAIGSTGAGKALALDVLNHQVTFVTDLGKDKERDLILDVFKKHPKIRLKILDSNQTTTHTNIMYHQGHRISVFTKDSNKVQFDPSIETYIKESDVVFLNINPYCKQYIPMIKKHHKLTVVDLHDYDPGNPYHHDFIEAADIMIVSGVHIQDQISFLESHISNKKVIVITNGIKGSIAMDHLGQIYRQKAFLDLPLVDANGAGDTFSSAFAMHYIENQSVNDALKFGSIAGAYACASETLYSIKATTEQINKHMKTTF